MTTVSRFAPAAKASFARPPAVALAPFGSETELHAAHLARAATHALHDELALYPKPGLVSFVDDGSHSDMTAHTFLRSIASLREYFRDISVLGAAAAPFSDLRHLAIEAERRMLGATGGVNTHRGAIFTLGMLCAAAARCRRRAGATISAASLRAALLETWGEALAAHAGHGEGSNGQCARQALGSGGARHEAAAGFPVLFACAVPALRLALDDGLDRRHALLQTFFAVMATLDDTNLVHRAGAEGLRLAQGEAQRFLAAGGARRRDAVAHAEAIHRLFVSRRMSPGGAADVLAAACWVVRICA